MEVESLRGFGSDVLKRVRIPDSGWQITVRFNGPPGKVPIFFLCRQLDFPSEPGVANKMVENEPKSCLSNRVAYERKMCIPPLINGSLTLEVKSS